MIDLCDRYYNSSSTFFFKARLGAGVSKDSLGRFITEMQQTITKEKIYHIKQFYCSQF
jgi:hypothetical protein